MAFSVATPAGELKYDNASALPCGTALPIKDTLLRILRDGETAKDGEAWLEYLLSLGV